MFAHADPLERRGDGTPVGGSGAAERSEGGVAAHHDDVADGDREGPVDRLGLRYVGDAARLAAGWRAQDLDAAAPRPEETRHHLEQRALAGAVRADDGQERSRFDGQGDVLQHRAGVVPGGHVGEPEIGVGASMSRVEAGIDGRQLPVRGWVLVRMVVRRRHCSAPAIRSTSQRINPSYVSTGGSPRVSV